MTSGPKEAKRAVSAERAKRTQGIEGRGRDQGGQMGEKSAEGPERAGRVEREIGTIKSLMPISSYF